MRKNCKNTLLLYVLATQLPDDSSKAETRRIQLGVKYLIVELCICLCCTDLQIIYKARMEQHGSFKVQFSIAQIHSHTYLLE